MKRWGFNYRLFFKKNMTGLTVLALFGASAAVWDNDLFLKSIALSERKTVKLRKKNRQNLWRLTPESCL